MLSWEGLNLNNPYVLKVGLSEEGKKRIYEENRTTNIELSKITVRSSEAASNFSMENVANSAVAMSGYMIPKNSNTYVPTSTGTKGSIQEENSVNKGIAERVFSIDRSGSGLKNDVNHRAESFVTQEQILKGNFFMIIGGDGRTRSLLQIKTIVNGVSGIAEFIFDSEKGVTHQSFIPGGIITGNLIKGINNACIIIIYLINYQYRYLMRSTWL